MPLKELAVLAAVMWLAVCVVSLPEWSLQAESDDMARITRLNNESIQRQLVPINRGE